MDRIEIVKLFQTIPEDGTAVKVSGWVKTARESKHIGFLEINDGSCFKNLQIIIEAQKFDDFKTLANLPVGSAVTITGRIVLTPKAKQPFEVNAEEVQIEGLSAPDYPLQKKRHGLEFLRTLPHLRARTNTYQAVFKIRSEAAYALHSFFHENGFVYVHTPVITGSDCEGAGEMFHVTTLDLKNPPLDENGNVDYSQDFFGQEANPTVSGQLEGESFALAFGKIYTFGPTFRAENFQHAASCGRVLMVEPEIAFADLAGEMMYRSHD